MCFNIGIPRDLANVNALKNHVRSLLLHKSENICYISRYFLHYSVSPFNRCNENAISTDYARSKAGRTHHVTVAKNMYLEILNTMILHTF